MEVLYFTPHMACGECGHSLDQVFLTPDIVLQKELVSTVCRNLQCPNKMIVVQFTMPVVRVEATRRDP